MTGQKPLRPGDRVTDLPLTQDASLVFIGHVETPWRAPSDCPKQGQSDGPVCTLVLNPAWDMALAGIENHPVLDVLYWLHRSRRDLLLQNPRHRAQAEGTFALRSPARPNPIGLARVTLLSRDGPRVAVQGLDCVTGTPLIDIKPARCHH